jgi:hypothetical protein
MLTWEKMVIVKGKLEWQQHTERPHYENSRDILILERARVAQQEQEEKE